MTLTIVAAVLAGVSSGVLAALVTPGAQRRAHEVELRQAGRRDLVRDSRAMLAEANDERWTSDDFWKDARFLALLPHLTAGTRLVYGDPSAPDDLGLTSTSYTHPEAPHSALSRELAALESGWRLA